MIFYYSLYVIHVWTTSIHNSEIIKPNKDVYFTQKYSELKKEMQLNTVDDNIHLIHDSIGVPFFDLTFGKKKLNYEQSITVWMTDIKNESIAYKKNS